MLKSSPDRYGAIPITIHWLTTILIVLALGMAARLAHNPSQKSHKLSENSQVGGVEQDDQSVPPFCHPDAIFARGTILSLPIAA